MDAVMAISVTYEDVGRSVLNYAAPIWTPTVSSTNWGDLQQKQNVALRATASCVLMRNIDHLLNETKIIPVKEYSKTLSQQFLLDSHIPSRVDH